MENGLFLVVLQGIQIAILAAVVWATAKTIGKDRPHLAHALWALVLLKCITPPIWSSPIGVFSWIRPMTGIMPNSVNPDSSDLESARSSLESSDLEPITLGLESEPQLKGDQRISAQSSDSEATIGVPRFATTVSVGWQTIALAVWIAGTVWGLTICIIRFLVFLRRLRRMPVIDDPLVEQAVQELAVKLRVRRPVQVKIIDSAIGPAVLGVFRPTILLPRLITQDRAIAQLRPLIAHELIHIRRGDLWWAMLQTVAVSLWWLHPLVWLATRMLTREAERSCDEETIAGLECPPAEYARSLLDVLEQKNQLQVAAALPGVRPVDVTANRLERIMRLGQRSQLRTPRWIWFVMLVAALAVLPGANLVKAQQQIASPRPSKPAPDPGPLPAHKAAWSIHRIGVQDILDSLVKSGHTEEAAAELMIQRLPAAPVDPLNRDAELSTEGGTIHLGGNQPPLKILKGTLYVIGSKQYREAIASHVAHFRNYGFDSAKISATLIQVPKDLWKEIDLKWSASDGGVTSEFAETKETVESDSGEIGTIVEPTVATIEENRVDDFLRSIADAQVLSRPTIITHNGRVAAIEIGQSKSLVVSFRSVRDSSGKPVFKPVHQEVQSGIRLKMRPEFVDSDKLQLQFDLNISRIQSIESVPLPIRNDENPLHIQIPQLVNRTISTAVRATLGETVAIGVPPTQGDDDENYLLCLIRCEKVASPGPVAGPKDGATSDLPTLPDPAQPSSDTRDIESSTVFLNPLNRMLQKSNSKLEITGDIESTVDENRVMLRGKQIAIRWDDGDQIVFGEGELQTTGGNVSKGRFQHKVMVKLNGISVRSDTVEMTNDRITARGDVHVEWNDHHLSGDSMIWNRGNEITFHGNVLVASMRTGRVFQLSADEFAIDLKTQRVKLLRLRQFRLRSNELQPPARGRFDACPTAIRKSVKTNVETQVLRVVK